MIVTIADAICAATWLIAREMRGVQIMKRRRVRKIGYSMITAGMLAGWCVCGVYERSNPNASLWPYIIALLICMGVTLIRDQVRKRGRTGERKDV